MAHVACGICEVKDKQDKTDMLNGYNHFFKNATHQIELKQRQLIAAKWQAISQYDKKAFQEWAINDSADRALLTHQLAKGMMTDNNYPRGWWLFFYIHYKDIRESVERMTSEERKIHMHEIWETMDHVTKKAWVDKAKLPPNQKN
jgi:hypothetical protein